MRKDTFALSIKDLVLQEEGAINERDLYYLLNKKKTELKKHIRENLYFPVVTSSEDYEGMVNYLTCPLNRWRFENTSVFRSYKNHKTEVHNFILKEVLKIYNVILNAKFKSAIKMSSPLVTSLNTAVLVDYNDELRIALNSEFDYEISKTVFNKKEIYNTLFLINFERILKMDMTLVMEALYKRLNIKNPVYGKKKK